MRKIILLIFILSSTVIICQEKNIYNSDGTLAQNRLVTMGDNFISFSNNGSALSGGKNKVPFSGFTLRGTTGGKFLDKGVSLEFVLPANTDGYNYWSLARIITVPGTLNTNDATGKMVLGTRRMFNKYGTGSQWYFGDDLVIDGVGNIGIGTLTPKAKLDVRGKIIADEVQIKVNTGADFVFNPDYNLRPLSEVKDFVTENKHLPDIPSEKQMQEDGLNLNDMQIKLLQKIEELTLYVIELKEENLAIRKELLNMKN